jgi:hypothetical protein
MLELCDESVARTVQVPGPQAGRRALIAAAVATSKYDLNRDSISFSELDDLLPCFTEVHRD